ncbi:MAG: thiamine diphosphokinase [Treponema sp.]|nr:thiamine diphosphokinase [Treponema sp.]
MLGIIFTGGEAPNGQIIKRLIETEVKDALFVAADSGFAAAQDAGITPDIVIGDFDSLDKPCLENFPKERVIRFEQDKDYSDTELAFSLAVEKGCSEIWIIGGGGGRIDHLFAIRSLFERDLFPARWITACEDIHCIDAQTTKNQVGANLHKDAIVSVFPLGAGPWEAKSEGLKWPLTGLSWDRGFFGLSNAAVDGNFSIIAESGRFMVILQLCAPL